MSVAALPFTDCAAARSGGDTAADTAAIHVQTVYGQLIQSDVLRLTFLANSSAQLVDQSNDTSTPLLSTLFAPTTALTIALGGDNHARFCQLVRPPSPLNASQSASGIYCPLPPGPLAFGVQSPLAHPYQLISLSTRVRVVDASSPPNELACVQVDATPLQPSASSVYGPAVALFWFSVALALAFWILHAIARIQAAWQRGRQRVRSHNLWSHVQRLGLVVASALSGEQLSVSPALLRFCTPSMRDVLYHTQWCAALSMAAVQWPRFTYPFFAQTAWASLLYNVSLTQGHDRHWDPLQPAPFSPPSAFADQIANPQSSLFLDTSLANNLMMFPNGTTTGIPALAAAVGVRPQDAFNNATAIFLLILGGLTFGSLLLYLSDVLLGMLCSVGERRKSVPLGSSVGSWSKSAEVTDLPAPGEDGAPPPTRPPSRTLLATSTNPPPRGWMNHRIGQSSFHAAVLHGNLVRILQLFHLPITAFACFQFTQGPAASSTASVVLAAVVFAVFSVGLPAYLLLRIFTTPTSKLYEETRTLLALGPMYNHFSHGSQRFAGVTFGCSLAYGILLGAGQRSGTAQSIIILVCEVAVALVTSVWLPWGRGATMGGISFLFCVARIISAVLLVILCPVVSVGDAAGGWVALAILFVQALIFVFFFFVLVVKLTEALVRAVYRVPFDQANKRDTGLLGALAFATRKPGHAHSHRHHSQRHRGKRPSPSARSGSTVEQRMLPSPTPPGALDSVLRPDDLSKYTSGSYREENDVDEEGRHIMGDWRFEEFDEPPSPSPAPPPASASSSGFTRVAGGRANMDAPYTMEASASTSSTSAPSPSSLPPGAMPSMAPHARRKSQTAIIEGDPPPRRRGSALRHEVTLDDDVDHDDDPRKARDQPLTSRGGGGGAWAKWFGGRRRGTASEGDRAPMLSPDPQPKPSFVVLRERKPASPREEPPADSADLQEGGERGFSVVRGKRAGRDLTV